MKNIFAKRNFGAETFPKMKSVGENTRKTAVTKVLAAKTRKDGFTLIEILVVIGIIAILAAIVIVAINPSRQFAQARNSQRQSNVEAILNAIGQRMADNQGLFRTTTDTTCTAAMDITTASSTIASGSASGTVDLRPCLVPTYMSELPVDPTVGSMAGATYNTGYTVVKDATTGRVTVSAPAALQASELSQVISLTR